MKAILNSTSKIVELNGIPARIWEGETDSGIKIHAFISRIAIDKNEPDKEQFEKELQQCNPPLEAIQSYTLKLIL